LYMMHLPSWANQKLANIEKIIESSAGEVRRGGLRKQTSVRGV
jgi:hypothetical protein